MSREWRGRGPAAASPGARRPTLLFLAPTLPARGGNGLAMRAGVFLDALARDFDVTLLVLPLAGSADDGLTPFVAKRVRRAFILPLAGMLDPLWDLSARVIDPAGRARALIAYPRPALCRFATSPCLRAVAAAVAGEPFDALHVMRLYLAPYAWPLLPPAPHVAPVASLDLDDDEPSTHRRLARLHGRAGRADEARIELAEASKYEALAQAVLPRFRRVISAAPLPGSAAMTVPNTVAVPRTRPRTQRPTRRLLFVGNLSYLPNAEGIGAFAAEVLPMLQGLLGKEVCLRIAGSAPPAGVMALAQMPGVQVVPDPVRLAPHYEWADVVVVPLSTGGGSRIKLLEAFAHRVPVISTTIGAEGIAATHGEHLLLADTAEALAASCAELLADPARASALAERARRLVIGHYSHAKGRAAVGAALRLPPGHCARPA